MLRFLLLTSGICAFAGVATADAAATPRARIQTFQRAQLLSRMETAAARAAESVRWGGRGVVAFVSGNAAMVPFMLNEMVHIARLPVPFKVLWVPLDMEGLLRLVESGNGTVYDGIARTGQFGAMRSDFREADYNRMAMVKWDVAIELLELGYDVLILDPDLAILRNPIPYFETLGVCDLSMQLDSLMDPTYENVLARGGFAFRREGFDNYYNTGGVLIRAGAGGASGRVLPWLRLFRSFAQAEYAHGSDLDDQALFNRFLLWEHKFSASATQNGKGAYAIQQVMSNGCLEYEAMCSSAERASSSQRCSGADATVAVSAYPLNPHMFLPRPHVQRLGLPRRIIHRPFWWHANWAANVSQKLKAMREEGDWLLPTEPSSDGV